MTELASEIVSAYVAKNHVPAADLPKLIKSVYTALSALRSSGKVSAPAPESEKPTATQILKSVRYNCIVSFIDGKTYKTLKRHLTAHGLNPQSYRERYGLPANYPMVAPSYSEQRSGLAKAIGLGKPGAQAAR